jgi:peptidoglycan/LPS O-acetylase OafA/YrhL
MKRQPLSAISTLHKHVESKENNLNVLRLFLALLVLYSHCYPLAIGSSNRAGYAAVDLFFFISGLLITASWLRSKSMNDYLRKRVLRIFPGFIGALLVSTVIMTAVNPTGLFKTVVSWQGLKSFIYGCLTLSSDSLIGPEVFPHNPFPKCVDGSMWTIPIEFECYLGVCVIGLFCLFKFRWLIMGIFIYNYLLVCKSVYRGWDFSNQDRRFFTLFLAGVCAWLWRDKIPLHWSVAFGSCVLLLLPAFTPLPWLIVEPVALTYIALWLGYARPLEATRWCDTTDLSYGVYLYAFPVQQLIASNAWGRNVWVMLIVSIPVTLVMALASWHLVEKRFLAMKASRFIDRDPAEAPPPEMAIKDTQLKQAF